MTEQGWLTGWGESPRSVPCGAKGPPAWRDWHFPAITVPRALLHSPRGEIETVSRHGGACDAPRSCAGRKQRVQAHASRWVGVRGPTGRLGRQVSGASRWASTGGPDSHGAC